MHPLDIVFWVFAASVAAFIGWNFLRMFIEILSDRRHRPAVKRPARPAEVAIPVGAAGGVSSGGDAASLMSASADSGSITYGEAAGGEYAGESGGDSSSGDSGGGDFSGGGGESGGGGSSGGW